MLYRLSHSAHRERFILKGGFLLSLWLGDTYRPTRDVDFHSQGEPSLERLVATFREICSLPDEEGGVVFDPASVQGEQIREDGV